MIYNLQKRYFEVLNIAVHPEYRRMLVGSVMLDKLKSKLSDERRTSILLVVNERNLAAQVWLRNNGFLAKKVHKGLYNDLPDVDAYSFWFGPAREVGYLDDSPGS
jgi:ribosomal protein S18 acetylase RimI-like enzyme